MSKFGKKSHGENSSPEKEPWPPAAFVWLDIEDEDDQKLVEYRQKGSPEERENAFSAIYNRYCVDIWRFIRSKVSSQDDAKDIFNDVCIIAKTRLIEFVWPDNPKSEKPLKCWLFTMTRHKRSEYFR